MRCVTPFIFPQKTDLSSPSPPREITRPTDGYRPTVRSHAALHKTQISGESLCDGRMPLQPMPFVRCAQRRNCGRQNGPSHILVGGVWPGPPRDHQLDRFFEKRPTSTGTCTEFLQSHLLFSIRPRGDFDSSRENRLFIGGEPWAKRENGQLGF